MLRTFLVAATAISVSIFAGVAKADTITASLYSPLTPGGATPVIINLAGVTPPSDTTLDGTGYTVTFSVGSGQGVVDGSSDLHAVPVAGATGTGDDTPEYSTGGFGSPLTTNIDDSGNYFSTGTGTITITFSSPQTSLALLWGSIDTGNSVILNDGTTITGTEVQAAASGFVSNGFQGPGGSAYVVIDSTSSFTTVELTSSVVSFESADIAAASQPFVSTVPEPTSVVLIGTGLGLAVLLRRRIVC
ncbi:MAG TPA: PEP-CTERM sorting domain-containing protein [Bryobacteraceae bacterium]|nr:PEP-CTERM sorting domain-containing protein [Bryobacteraceae bacterium]